MDPNFQLIFDALRGFHQSLTQRFDRLEQSLSSRFDAMEAAFQVFEDQTPHVGAAVEDPCFEFGALASPASSDDLGLQWDAEELASLECREKASYNMLDLLQDSQISNSFSDNHDSLLDTVQKVATALPHGSKSSCLRSVLEYNPAYPEQLAIDAAATEYTSIEPVFVSTDTQRIRIDFAPDDPCLLRFVRLGSIECALRGTLLGDYDSSLDDDPESSVSHFNVPHDRGDQAVSRIGQAPAVAAALRADAIGAAGGGLLASVVVAGLAQATCSMIHPASDHSFADDPVKVLTEEMLHWNEMAELKLCNFSAYAELLDSPDYWNLCQVESRTVCCLLCLLPRHGHRRY